jgi:hypothetical protein
MQRISGRDVEARMAGGTRIAFEQATLDLDDGITGTTSQGYSYGWVSGAIKGEGELQVQAFGVKLRMPNFDFKGDGGEKTMHTVRFIVSSPDFVRLNGTPLARRPAG